MSTDPDDEWEYEYSTTETEDFYLTVDLTTHVADAGRQREQLLKKAEEPQAQTTQQPVAVTATTRDNASEDATNDIQSRQRDHDDDHDAIVTDAPTAAAPDSTSNSAAAPPPQSDPTAHAAPSLGTFQILGAHTDEPIVRLDTGVYRCAWSTDIGTQVFVARAGTVKAAASSAASAVARKGYTVDVVGLSRARLLGRPVKLTRRADGRVSEGEGMI